jgi:transcriptional regulator with XRE-family HTH domain
MDIEDFKRRFGMRVQNARRRRDLTQEQLAEQIQRTADTVSLIERGAASTRIETAYRIAEVLGVPLSNLFEIDVEAPADRERRQLIERLVDLIKTEDAATLAAAIAQTEILLQMKRERQG